MPRLTQRIRPIEVPQQGAPYPLAQGRLDSCQAPHYWVVTLWGGQTHYEQAIGVTKSNTIAMTQTDTWVDERTGLAVVQDKLGELHFVSGSWDVTTVAHEVAHALLHRLRYLDVRPEQVLDELSPRYDSEAEEVLAYETGDWVDALLVWLTETDPKSRYPRNVFDR